MKSKDINNCEQTACNDMMPRVYKTLPLDNAVQTDDDPMEQSMNERSRGPGASGRSKKLTCWLFQSFCFDVSLNHHFFFSISLCNFTFACPFHCSFTP